MSNTVMPAIVDQMSYTIKLMLIGCNCSEGTSLQLSGIQMRRSHQPDLWSSSHST